MSYNEDYVNLFYHVLSRSPGGTKQPPSVLAWGRVLTYSYSAYSLNSSSSSSMGRRFFGWRFCSLSPSFLSCFRSNLRRSLNVLPTVLLLVGIFVVTYNVAEFLNELVCVLNNSVCLIDSFPALNSLLVNESGNGFPKGFLLFVGSHGVCSVLMICV